MSRLRLAIKAEVRGGNQIKTCLPFWATRCDNIAFPNCNHVGIALHGQVYMKFVQVEAGNQSRGALWQPDQDLLAILAHQVQAGNLSGRRASVAYMYSSTGIVGNLWRILTL